VTPAALTPAAKRKAARKLPGEGPHPRQVRRGAGSAPPRRVSGPVAGSSATAARERAPVPPPPVAAPRAGTTDAPRARATATPPARTSAAPRARASATPRGRARASATPRARTASARPRAVAKPGGLLNFSLPALRVALPALPRPHVRRHPRAAQSRPQSPPLPLGRRALAFVRGLPDHAMLDRLIRGRAWIPVLGVMLAGIVFMQVQELKLGAAFGRAVQQTAQLSTQNQALLASTGTLADTSRIESIATRLGYVMPAPSQTGFLAGWGDHLAAALSTLRPANPNQYLNAPGTTNGAIAGTPVSTPSYAVGTPAGTGATAAGTAGATSTSATTTGGTTTGATSTGGTTTGGTTTGATTTGATSTGGTTTGTPSTGSTGTAATVPPAGGAATSTSTTTPAPATNNTQSTATTGGAQLPASGG